MSIDWTQALEKYAEPLHLEFECGMPPIVGKITYGDTSFGSTARQFIIVLQAPGARELVGNCYELVGDVHRSVYDVGFVVLHVFVAYSRVWFWRLDGVAESKLEPEERLFLSVQALDTTQPIPARVWALRHCRLVDELNTTGLHGNVASSIGDYLTRANKARSDCAVGLCVVVRALDIEQPLRDLFKAIVLLAAPWVTPARQ